jgi:hypothetical protein
MNRFNAGKKINEGNYTALYECNFKGKPCAVKMTKNTTHYVFLKFQFDAMMFLQNNVDLLSFRTPEVYDYFIQKKDRKEILVMEHIKNLFPLLFVFQNTLCDHDEIIKKLSYTISDLHHYGISGYDTEFFWSFEEEKIIVIDVGPRYTINCDTKEMIGQHIKLIQDIPWGFRNIIGDIISIERMHKLLYVEQNELNNTISEFDLQRYMSPDSVLKHIADVAKTHYLQIVGCFPPNKRKQVLSLFIDTYCQCNDYNLWYAKSFTEAYEHNISKHTAFLYYPVKKSVSRMSCSIENDMQNNNKYEGY